MFNAIHIALAASMVAFVAFSDQPAAFIMRSLVLAAF